MTLKVIRSGAFPKDYSLISLYLADLNSVVAHPDPIAIGEMYADSVFNEFFLDARPFPHITTSSTLRPAIGEKHNGTFNGGGVQISSGNTFGFNIQSEPGGMPIFFEDILMTAHSRGFNCVGSVSTSVTTINRCILKASATPSTGIEHVNGILKVNNTIFMDYGGPTDIGYNYNQGSDTSASHLFNCTFFKCKNGVKFTTGIFLASSIVRIINCIFSQNITSNVNKGAFPTNPNSTNNLFDSGGGAGDTYGANIETDTAVNLFKNIGVGTEDLHLKTLNNAISNGFDLTSEGFNVQFDIDNDNRVQNIDNLIEGTSPLLPYDIGADQTDPFLTFELHKSIGSGGGRDYSLPSLFTLDLNVGATFKLGYKPTGVIFNDSTINGDIANITTSINSFAQVKLSVAKTDRHSGSLVSGASWKSGSATGAFPNIPFINAGFSNSHVIIEHIRFFGNNVAGFQAEDGVTAFLTVGARLTVRHCIFDSLSSGRNSGSHYGIRVQGSNGQSFIYNNSIHIRASVDGAGSAVKSSRAIDITGGLQTAFIAGNSIGGLVFYSGPTTTGIDLFGMNLSSSGGSFTLKNNVIMMQQTGGAVNDIFGLLLGAGSFTEDSNLLYNNDATGPDSKNLGHVAFGGISSSDLADVWTSGFLNAGVGTVDFHLVADSPALKIAEDLSGSAVNELDDLIFDIDEEDRTTFTDWDMGYDQTAFPAVISDTGAFFLLM